MKTFLKKQGGGEEGGGVFSGICLGMWDIVRMFANNKMKRVHDGQKVCNRARTDGALR